MRVVICGYYGYGNAGDEALLRTLLQMLPPTVTPWVISGDPQATQHMHPVTAISRRDWGFLWAGKQEPGVLIWGGGSLIQDRTSWRSPLYYLGLMGLAQRWGWSTIAWGQGIGPIQRSWIRDLTRNCLQGCQAVSVRDRGSDALLQSWGIPHQVAPDPVWALAATPVPTISAVPCIAVILRPHAEFTPARLRAVIGGLQRLQQQVGAQLLLIPFQLHPQPQRSDLPLAQQIHAELPDHSQILEVRDPQLLMGILGQVTFTITMRYHGLVMAATMGSRCFGLSYDPKVRYLLDALSLPGWDLSDIPLDPDVIATAWLQAYQGSPLCPTIRQQWQQQAQYHGALLAALGAG